jgi:hypothetical protein
VNQTISSHNKEQKEAEAIQKAVAQLCKSHGFQSAQLQFGDMDGKLVFLLKGITATSPEPQSVLGIIDQK